MKTLEEIREENHKNNEINKLKYSSNGYEPCDMEREYFEQIVKPNAEKMLAKIR